MDYLDPEKRRQHAMILMIGYVFVAVAILLTTYILLNLTYGYARGKNGQIVQNGLLFFSSAPNPASIYIDGKPYKSQTNTRIFLPAGSHNFTIAKSGYHDWKRTITLEGGSVQHFDYPRLFPNSFTTKSLQAYTAAPLLATQSPDHRWLVLMRSDAPTSFELYDLKTPVKAVGVLDVPSNVISKANSHTWQLVDWSNDNDHVLLQHGFDGKTEYILLDRANPDQSLNLTSTLGANPTAISLIDKKYDKYYLYDQATRTLQTASLKTPTAVKYLDHVLAYKSYSDDTMLYASDAVGGKVEVNLLVGTKTYHIRDFPSGTTYALDLTSYSGKLYVVAGASSESKVYIYKDPIAQLQASDKALAVPKRVLHVEGVNYVGFSPNAEFIIGENGQKVATYDAEYEKSYTYTLSQPLDAPQAKVVWMDGNRLIYSSQGKLIVRDYDNVNQQTLVSTTPQFLPFFSPDYKYLFTLAPSEKAGETALDQTPLLLPADL